MSSAITPDAAIANYQAAYTEFFGTEPPTVRKVEGCGFDVRFSDRSKRYSKTDLLAVTSMMISLKDEVF